MPAGFRRQSGPASGQMLRAGVCTGWEHAGPPGALRTVHLTCCLAQDIAKHCGGSPRSARHTHLQRPAMKTFDAHGVRFHYPDDWSLSHDHDGGSLNVNLQTPGTAFWSLTLLEDRPPVEDVLNAAIAAYEEEYPQVDVYRHETSLAETPTASCDLDFVYLDLVNSAALRSILTEDFTALVVFQGEGREFDQRQDEFHAVMASLQYATLE
jgi:hypothetical protein